METGKKAALSNRDGLPRSGKQHTSSSKPNFFPSWKAANPQNHAPSHKKSLPKFPLVSPCHRVCVASEGPLDGRLEWSSSTMPFPFSNSIVKTLQRWVRDRGGGRQGGPGQRDDFPPSPHNRVLSSVVSIVCGDMSSFALAFHESFPKRRLNFWEKNCHLSHRPQPFAPRCQRRAADQTASAAVPGIHTSTVHMYHGIPSQIRDLPTPSIHRMQRNTDFSCPLHLAFPFRMTSTPSALERGLDTLDHA